MTLSKHLRSLTICGALLAANPALAQEGRQRSFRLEEQNLSLNDKLKISATVMAAEYEYPPVGMFLQLNAQLSEEYYAPTFGLAYWHSPNLQYGLGVGWGNVGGFVWLGTNRCSFYSSVNLKRQTYWYEGHLNYQFGEMFSFSLSAQRFSGVGPRISLKGLITNLTFVLIPITYEWETGKTGYALTLRFDI